METQHLDTIGHICATLQRPYAAIRQVLADIGAEPVLTLDGRAYYAQADVAKVAEALSIPVMLVTRAADAND